ncbi:hypothetical protein Tco_1386438 [Tanacetum coccineum]
MLLNLDQLEKQLDKEEIQEDRSMAAFWVINIQFQMFIDSQFTWDYDSQMTKKTRHKRQYDSRMNERQMQSKEGKVDSCKALDASLVVTECSAIESENSNSKHAFNKLVNESSGIESGKLDTSSSSRNYLTHVVDAAIRLVNDQVPLMVVRQPNAFKSVRPRISKPRFASQVDVKHNLPKPVTPHYLPNFRESAPTKPHHVNAPISSRNCQKESYGSNDMAHNHFLEEARKKTQDRNWNLKPKEMPSARTRHTPNACTPKPRTNNQMFRNWPASKNCNVKLNIVQKADHSRNPSSCSDSKHLVCLTCQKCVFNENHDACVTKFLKEVNSRAKIQSPKSRNSIKPAGKKSNVNKPERWIFKGYRLSLNKSSDVHEKTSPRSCLRWKPMGRIFKTVGLRWVPTGKIFTDSTTKVDSEPPNGSNDDITNPYKCDQTLNVSVGTLNLSAATSFNPKKERLRVWLLNRLISQKLGVQGSQM